MEKDKTADTLSGTHIQVLLSPKGVIADHSPKTKGGSHPVFKVEQRE